MKKFYIKTREIEASPFVPTRLEGQASNREIQGLVPVIFYNFHFFV